MASKVVLSIAGFDPSSGAGMTADLKTAAAHGCFGVACITALTVQSTQGVSRVHPVPGEVVAETLGVLAGDMEISAIRIGMLGSAEVARSVAAFLRGRLWPNVVLDPVLWSSSGADLLDREGVGILLKGLVPLSQVVTPNMAEAERMVGKPVRSLDQMAEAAVELQRLGAKNVLVTGGHLPENTDLLRTESGDVHHLQGRRVESRATHGTGCALATALACNLANGMSVLPAAEAAKEYVRKAIEAAYPVGKGSGPLNHLFKLGQ